MRIPSREEFSPLPEVIGMLGLPDPLAVLPQLENQLEAVSGSTQQIRAYVNGLRDAVSDLGTDAKAVVWQGAGGDRFRSTTAELMTHLRLAASDVENLATEVDATAEGIKRVLRIILVVLGSAAGIVALIAGFLWGVGLLGIGAGAVAVVLGVVGTLLIMIAALLDEIEWLGLRLKEFVELVVADTRKRLERLRERVGRGEPIWLEPEAPGRWVESEPD